MLNLLKTLLKFALIAALVINSAGQSYALRPMAAGASALDEGMFITETVKSSSTGNRKGIDTQFSDKGKIDKQLEKITKFLKDGYRPNGDGYKTHIINFWHQPYISTRAAGSIGHFSKKGYTERVDKEFWQPLEKLLSDVLKDNDSADLKTFFDNLKKILRKSEHVLMRSRSFRVRYATNTLAYAKALELIDRQQEILNRFGIKIDSEFKLLLEDIINDYFDSHNEYYGVEQDGTLWVKVFAGDVMRFVLEQSRLGSHLIEAEEVLLSNLDFIRQYSARFVLFSERKIRSPYDIKDTPISVYNKAMEFLKMDNIYDDHIVDFGCGRGRFLIYLDSRFRTDPFVAPPLHSWGYDNLEVMVKSARNSGLNVRKRDLSNKKVLNRLTNQLSKTYGYKDSYSDQFNKAVAIDLLQDFTTEGKENFLDFLNGKAFLEKGRCFISLFIGKGDRKRAKEDFLKLIQKRENLIVEFAEADDSRVYIGVIKKSSIIKSVYNRDTSQARSPKTSSAGQQKIEVIEKVNPPTNKPILVLCDVHGTLLAPTWEKEYREVFKKIIGDHPPQEWMEKYIFGKTDDEILKALSTESIKPATEVADIIEQVRNQIREKETTQEIPGAIDFLWTLRRVGIPSAIISGTERKLLISQLERVGLYYATSRYWPEKHIYARTTEDKKEHNRAEVIERIWEDFDRPTIVYFDDWIEGMQKVRQLGGICVGPPQGEGEVFRVNREKLVKAGAHYILSGGYDYEEIVGEILNPVFVNVLDICSGDGEGTWTHPTLASLMAGDSISPGSFDGIVLGVRKWMAKKGICNILVQVTGLDKDKKMVEEAKMCHYNVHLIHLVEGCA